jgi:hypothetical protein
MGLHPRKSLYYDMQIFNTAITLSTRFYGSTGLRPTRFYNAGLTVWRRKNPSGQIQTRDIAVRKNGYTQHDVNTIRIDAEATSSGVRLADPTIDPMARGGGCGF